MQRTNTIPVKHFSFRHYSLGGDDVGKGSNRETPGESEGARPPREEDYEEAKDEEAKGDPSKDEVDNEQKDRNKQR